MQPIKKKQKLGKLEVDRIKINKTRKKERKKHKEERRDKGHVKKRKKVQGSNKFIAVVSAIDITSKKRTNIGYKEDFVSKIPASNEKSVDAVFGRFKNGSHRIGLDVIEKNVVNSEAVNDEIKAGKLYPLLHASDNNEHLKLEYEKTIDDNDIPLLQVNEVPRLLGLNSALDYDKIHDAYVSKEERKSERRQFLPEVSSFMPSKSVTVRSTDAEVWLQSGPKQDAGLEEQSNIELNSLGVFKFVNTTEESDWSCLHGMFLPAPRVANAEVRYTR